MEAASAQVKYAGFMTNLASSAMQVYSAYAMGYLGAIEQSANSEVRNGTYAGELGKKEVEDRRKALDDMGKLQLGLMENTKYPGRWRSG